MLFFGPTQELLLATTNTGKTCERFWNNAGEWTGRVEISREEIPGERCSMHVYVRICSRL